MKTIDIGELVHQVEIQRRVSGVDPSGAPQETWDPIGVVDMGRPRKGHAGTEAFRADQVSAPVVTWWVMRYWDAMDPDRYDVIAERRLCYMGRAYNIVQAVLVDRREGLLLRTVAASQVPA